MNPLPEPVEPTDVNIARVRTNLKNLQHFNDQLYMYTITKTANCFLLLENTDNGDPGMYIGINLLCGAVTGIGLEYGFLGAVFANYFCGLIGEYSTAPPPSLLESYTSYITRIQATSIQADLDMANCDEDPVSNWNRIYSGSFNTPWGIKSAECTLGQLAAVDIPNEGDSTYDEMMVKAVFCFDQMLWWSVMNQKYQINGWNSGFMLPVTVYASDVPLGDTGMNNYCNNYMIQLPPHWTFWIYNHSTDKKGHDTSTYTIFDYSLGVEPTNRGYDVPIPNGAATYLFIDTIPGTVVNTNGLFNRVFVFNNFGLKKIEQK